MPNARNCRYGAMLWGLLVSAMPLAANATALAADPATPDREPIRIGMSAAFQGPSRQVGIELYRGIATYFSEVNRRGGIQGRPLQLIAYNDSYQPDRAVDNALRLLGSDKVLLLLGFTGTEPVTRVLPLLKKYDSDHGLMFFPFTGGAAVREAPYDGLVFNLRPSYRQETEALVGELVAHGHQRIAVFYQSDSFGRSGWGGVRKALTDRHLQLVGEATYARGTMYTGSLDRQVAILQSAKPDAIICIATYAASAAFIRDARRADLNVPITTVSFASLDSVVSLLRQIGAEDQRNYLQQLLFSSVVPDPKTSALPAVKEYRALMNQAAALPPTALLDANYQPSGYNRTSLEGFLDAKLLVAMLNRLGKNLTRASLAAAVVGMKDLDIGLQHPLSFQGRNQASDEVYFDAVNSNEVAGTSAVNEAKK